MKKLLIAIIPFLLFSLNLIAEETAEETIEEVSESTETNDSEEKTLASLYDIEEGKKLYNSNCAACHTIGRGKLTGPDLKGITGKLDVDWLITFIISSKSLIDAGDEYAVKIFNEYNKIPMPDHRHLSRENILNILSYIEDRSQPQEEIAKTEQASIDQGIAYTITNPQNSVIDLPLIKMVFWGSVFIVCAFMITLGMLVTRNLKYSY